MRRFCTLLAAGLVTASLASAATVTPGDSTAPWLGFMNVSNLPAPDGDGAFQFASGWGVGDLVVDFDDANNKLTFSPNQIADPDPYWYQGGGAPGAPGNKIMEANLYVEVNDDSLSGTTVDFVGDILSDTTTAAHEGFIFIRDFAPDYSSFNETIVPVTPGPFSISLATDAGPGRHVQYGFQMVGANVWSTDVAPFGNFMVGTIPEPATLMLIGLGGLACFRRR